MGNEHEHWLRNGDRTSRHAFRARFWARQRMIHMLEFTMPLNDSGNDVELPNSDGGFAHGVSYPGSAVREGEYIEFGQ